MITNEMLDAYDTAILNHSPCADHTCDCGQKFKTTGDWHDHKISTALAAAAPHLRAGWAAELLDEGILGAGYSVLMNPVAGDHPVATFTHAIRHMLTLLEGGGE